MFIKKPVTRPARGVGDAARRFFAGPMQCDVRQSQAARLARNKFGLAGRFEAQAVIDRCNGKRWLRAVSTLTPFGGKNEKSHAIRTARNGEDDMLKRCERREGGVRFDGRDRQMRVA